jgi:hypothetical protein
MEKLFLSGSLALFIFGVTAINAQSDQKEAYKYFSGDESELNYLAAQGWKVRSATVVVNQAGKPIVYCILYRELH